MENLFKTSKDFTEEERDRLLKQFEGSGLEYQQFAREHNIHEQTFKTWVWISRNPNASRKHHSPVERKKTVEAFLACGPDVNRDDFAKAWGISKTTLSHWLSRYDEYGSEGLMNGRAKSGDKRVGSRIPIAITDEIIKVKKQDPSFGIKKIKNFLYRFRGMKVSTGKIRKTVVGEGLPLARPKKKRRKSSDRVRRFERAKPMQLWQSDITQFTLGPSSMRVYLTVFMDDHSRYIVGWRLQSRQTADLVIDAFKDACVRFGKPQEVLTDQGRQYFAWRGKSDLEKLLEKEGIKHVVSRAHHPQTLGKCERFWETVQNEFWVRVHPQDLEEARQRLKLFIDHYNHQRPHQGLDGQVPADRFFGIAEDVRLAIEKSVEQNALAMALGELPKAPAFLFGQVGDQRIAFHGTSGKFYLTHENLGEKNGESISTIGETNVIGTPTSNGACGEEAETKPRSEGVESEIKVPSDSGSGPVGESDSRGQAEGPGVCKGDHGVLDGEVIEGSSNHESGHEAGEVLAVNPTSNSGNDGGSTNPAAL